MSTTMMANRALLMAFTNIKRPWSKIIAVFTYFSYKKESSVCKEPLLLFIVTYFFSFSSNLVCNFCQKKRGKRQKIP